MNEPEINHAYIIDNTKKAQEAFGYAWGASHVTLSSADVEALKAGKQLAIYDGEYVQFLSTHEPRRPPG
ncbi:MAG: hypothetical protein ABF904_11700 [Ethanoligenens sp.]